MRLTILQYLRVSLITRAFWIAIEIMPNESFAEKTLRNNKELFEEKNTTASSIKYTFDDLVSDIKK